MRVVGRSELEEFKGRHADANGHVDAWLAEVQDATWETPHDLKRRYPSASILGDRVVIFNIRNNRYRLAVRISYQAGIVRVLKIGTHQEYDSWSFES